MLYPLRSAMLCACLSPDWIEQNSDIRYCNVCDKNVGGGSKNFETHEKSGPHQKRLTKANPSQPPKGQITSFFGPPKPKTAPGPSVTLQPLQLALPEDSIYIYIYDVDAAEPSDPAPFLHQNMLLSHLRVLTASLPSRRTCANITTGHMPWQFISIF